MSKVSTLSQGAGILTLLDEQKLDLDQVQAIHPYLVHLAKAAKNQRLPKIETFRAFMEDRAGVEMQKRVIDFDKPSRIPDGWGILPDPKQLPNRMKGVMEYDPAKVVFHLDPGQKDGNVILGNKLRQKLKNVPVFGAQLLDFYLDNTHLIPEEWKKDGKGNTRHIFFWGTIYRSAGNDLCVRHLCWRGGSWGWHFSWLIAGWDVSSPAARYAS